MLRNTNIEVVQACRAWLFFLKCEQRQGLEGIERPYLCIGIPETQQEKRGQQATYYIYPSYRGMAIVRVELAYIFFTS